MTEWNITSATDELLNRERDHREGGRLTDEWPELGVSTAYEIQDALLRKKIENGETGEPRTHRRGC